MAHENKVNYLLFALFFIFFLLSSHTLAPLSCIHASKHAPTSSLLLLYSFVFRHSSSSCIFSVTILLVRQKEWLVYVYVCVCVCIYEYVYPSHFPPIGTNIIYVENYSNNFAIYFNIRSLPLRALCGIQNALFNFIIIELTRAYTHTGTHASGSLCVHSIHSIHWRCQRIVQPTSTTKTISIYLAMHA